MALIEWVALVIIGLFAGLFGGLLGVGGSIIMIPAMTEVLGPDQHKFQAAAMIVNFFVVVPAVYQHRRARAIDLPTVGRLVPLGVVAVLLGVGLSELPFFGGTGEAYLRLLFGTFLLCVAGLDLYRALLRRTPKMQDLVGETTNAGDRPGQEASPGTRRGEWLFAGAVAVPTGLVAGLLGVGGGVMAVPLQRRFLRVPMRHAIANSATIIVATSLIGASAKNCAYFSEHGNLTTLSLAAVLIPTAIVGSLIGSRLTHLLPLRIVKVAFFVLLLLAGVRFSYKALQSLPPAEAMPAASISARSAPAQHATALMDRG
jgi:uncharacterized membrane protein YfcA